MADKRYLTRQRQTWYLQLRVPEDVRQAIGKSEIIETLGSRDLAVAQTRRWDRVAYWHNQFEAIRGQPEAQRKADREVFQKELNRWGQSADEQPEEYPLEDALSDYLHDHERGQGTPSFDAAYAALKRLQGRPVEVPEKYQMSFSEAARRYLEETQRDPKARLTGQTLAQSEAVFRLFKDYTRDATLERITKDTATKFLDEVARLDPHWGRSPQTKSLTFGEIRDKFGNGSTGLSSRTLNRYSSSLAAVFKWAEKRGYWSGENPFAGQFRKVGSQRKAGWLPFMDDEVVSLPEAAAEFPESDAMRWVPLIGAYSGMRSNEICSLSTSDIKEQDGVHFFDVTGAKTEAGDRRVPIHNWIVEAGFLDYWQELPEGPLFPTLKPGGPDNKLNWYFTKRFGTLRQRLGIDRERLGFHSFRKAVATKLENARVPESEAVQVLGHEKLSMSYRVYSLGVDLKRLREIVEAIQYARGSRLQSQVEPQQSLPAA